MGIDPAELRHIPFEDFLRHERGQADLANLLYTSAEKLRQVRRGQRTTADSCKTCFDKFAALQKLACMLSNSRWM